MLSPCTSDSLVGHDKKAAAEGADSEACVGDAAVSTGLNGLGKLITPKITICYSILSVGVAESDGWETL